MQTGTIASWALLYNEEPIGDRREILLEMYNLFEAKQVSNNLLLLLLDAITVKENFLDKPELNLDEYDI